MHPLKTISKRRLILITVVLEAGWVGDKLY